MSSRGRRNAGRLLAIGTFLIAVVATQWPFEYRFSTYAVHYRWTRIDWHWFRGLDRDFVLNILMLAPLGFGYGLWREAGRLRAIGESLLLGIVASAGLELAQLVTRDRITSFLDLWHNAAGCAAGCILARLVAVRLARLA